MPEMDAIETKEIRGLSVKGMVTIISSTVMICGTVFGTYNSLKNSIERDHQDRINEAKIMDLRLQNMQSEINANTALYQNLNNKVEDIQNNQKK